MLALAPVLAAAAGAQTISPVIVEFREKARGSFSITNDAFVPVNVVLEPRSFSVDDKGEPVFRPLDKEVKIEFSATSFRIGPQQSYTVFYKAESLRLPCWFSVYATVTGATTPTGLQLVVELPHTVYLMTKQPLARESVVLLRADRKTPGQAIEAEVENRGSEFSRVRAVEVISDKGKQDFAGFPLFPGQKRKISLAWGEKGEPARLVLKFDKFTLEHPIRAVNTSP